MDDGRGRFSGYSLNGPLRDLVTVVLAMGMRSERRRVWPAVGIVCLVAGLWSELPPRSGMKCRNLG